MGTRQGAGPGSGAVSLSAHRTPRVVSRNRSLFGRSQKELTMANILVVDDDPTSRDLVVTVLRYGGHQMREAADGAEALIEAQTRPPDLIIADLLMPTMDGFEFVRRVREQAALAQTPVIFYTATYLESEARNLAQA